MASNALRDCLRVLLFTAINGNRRIVFDHGEEIGRGCLDAFQGCRRSFGSEGPGVFVSKLVMGFEEDWPTYLINSVEAQTS